MYKTHFGLSSRPFRAGPDHASYFPAASHESALNRLVQAIADDEGICLITGKPGIGKTLICRCLFERLGNRFLGAFVPNTHAAFTRTEILQAMLFDLGEEYAGKPEQELRLGLTQLLLDRFAEGQQTVVVVDEAQNLTLDMFEELRLLSNLEAGSCRAVHVVLSAQLDLGDRLRTAEYTLFRHRLATRVQLEPFTRPECVAYMAHRAAAGWWR